MPTKDKNHAGGHTHPQKDADRGNQGGDARADGKATEAGKPGKGPKESFGKSGAKDSH
jgi:hypothetical protein